MDKFIKIGSDIFNLEGITRISILENQSGISDRILIEVGAAVVVVDSALGGRKRMDEIRERLVAALKPQDWDMPEAA